MTIAAGLLSADGVVLAADTKESYGDTHTYVDKITYSQNDACSWAIAGSGESYLLDYMIPEIVGFLRGSKATKSDEVEVRLRNLMVALYKSDCIKSYPIDKAADLYTQFLLAAKFKDDEDPVLLVINSTLVTRAIQFGTVIGCGPLREFAEEIGMVSPFALERAKCAALCVVYEAKRRYSDVAGHTQLISIENSGKLLVEDKRKETQQEVLLDSIRTYRNMLTVSTLDASLTGTRFSQLLGRIGSHLKELHRDARRIGIAQSTANQRVWRKTLRKHAKKLASQKSEQAQ